jgi:hypothetical protein
MLKSEYYRIIDRVLFIVERASVLQIKHGAPKTNTITSIGRLLSPRDHDEICELLSDEKRSRPRRAARKQTKRGKKKARLKKRNRRTR